MVERRGYHIDDQYAPHFVTFTVVGWVDVFTRKECCEMVIDSLKYCVANKGLILYCYVIMPSHIHLIIEAEQESIGLSNVIRDLRKYLSKRIIYWIENSQIESRKEWLKLVFRYHARYSRNHKKYRIWQRGFHPKVLISPKFTYQKLNYIHNNPINAKMVKKAEDYVFSSASNYKGAQGEIGVRIIDFGSIEGYIPS